MAWSISGTYVAMCACQPVACPCPADGAPTAPDGVCKGVGVFHIDSGNSDAVDFSGVNWGLWNEWEGNPSRGDWKIGVVIDEGASDEQAQALERILSGQEGGAFAELGALIGQMLGVQRERIAFSNGETPRASIGDHTEIAFDPARGADGNVTTTSNAIFGFAPTFTIGKGSGRANSFGLTFEPGYGESAQYSFSSEGHEQIRA